MTQVNSHGKHGKTEKKEGGESDKKRVLSSLVAVCLVLAALCKGGGYAHKYDSSLI